MESYLASNISAIQQAFNVISLLQVSAYVLPYSEDVQCGDSFDYIVVGGGATGSIVASRLAEDKKTQVLLIEAGGNPPIETRVPWLKVYLSNSGSDWKYKAFDSSTTANCKINKQIGLSLGKVLGGSTNMNYLLFDVGNKKNYDDWAEIVNDKSWRADNILPYLVKSQNLVSSVIENSTDKHNFGYGGPFTITKENRSTVDEYLKAYKELGIPVVPTLSIYNSVGYSSALYSIKGVLRENTAYAYLSELQNYSNFHILTESEATEIIFDGNKNAVAVKVATEKGTVIIKAKKEIIVAAGPVNSCKLLMLSGIGPRSHLKSMNIKVRSDLPVGENMLSISSSVLIYDMKKTIAAKPTHPFSELAMTYIGNIALNNSQSQPQYQTVNFIQTKSALAKFCLNVYEFNDIICSSLFPMRTKSKNNDENQMLFTLVSDLNPTSRGKILLKSKNPKDAPLIYLKYLAEDAEVRRAATYVQDYNKVLRTKAFRKLGAELVEPDLEACKGLKKWSSEYWLCYVRCMSATRKYECGSCAMGKVVDSKFRVYGVKRLRVVDSSTIPIVPAGFLMGMVLAMGEKAADVIKKDNLE